jgi:hypothetical protein
VCSHSSYIQREAILVSDPAALRYIHQSEHADRFIRAPEWYAMADLLAGNSIGSAEGKDRLPLSPTKKLS